MKSVFCFQVQVQCTSVGGGGGEGCCRQTDPRVGSVVDRVEPLEEGLAKEEI